MKFGLLRAASMALHTYSPMIPNAIIWNDDTIKRTTMIADHPCRGTKPVSLAYITKIPYKSANNPKIKPKILIKRIGKKENATNESTNSLTFFPNVHFDFPISLFLLR